MERQGCYSTARVTAGRIERLERHAARLVRDALRLSLPAPERAAVEAVAQEVVRRELGRGDGVVRIEWSQDPDDTERAAVLRVTTRPLGPEPAIWRAISARTTHPGPGERHGAKTLALPALAAARAERDAAGVEEALLFDAAGRLVEGSRTNLLVVTHEDRVLTPAASLGAVGGLGLACVREALPEIRDSDAIDRDVLAGACELIATNAVRGAVPIGVLDGRAIGDGRAGRVAQRLCAVFGRALLQRC